MRAVLQRVSRASVSVGDEVVGAIEGGLLVLLGVAEGDPPEAERLLAKKVAGLRIFPDAEGKMNVCVKDAEGSLLVVSQFTLYGDTRKGRRPFFGSAALPEVAEPLLAELVEAAKAEGVEVITGRFGADMAVELVNAGPVTLWLDTAEWS